MRRLTISGQYAEDGKERRRKTREAAGHRCIRCGHPFETGKHGRGEWTPCDEKCTHDGPVRLMDLVHNEVAQFFPLLSTGFIAADLIKIHAPLIVQAQWRILTVHHFDGNKSNDAWWNLLSLCQRCHLTVQSRVNPEIPWLFEHSDWLKLFVAGFYARKYEGADLTREQVESRLDELLAYERKA